MRNELFIFGRFANDPQSILTAVERLANMGIERGPNLGVRTAKLRTTPFADGKSGVAAHDPKFSFRHENSLAPNASANETAPVPPGLINWTRAWPEAQQAVVLSGADKPLELSGCALSCAPATVGFQTPFQETVRQQVSRNRLLMRDAKPLGAALYRSLTTISARYYEYRRLSICEICVSCAG